ncbi:MAG TPA: response regulator [Noviherbaspirillum sp.]|nr:response regulator [Noviherbaspirillum sp.]
MNVPVPATILIVDDEERNRKLLEVFMQAEGYRTIVVDDGQTALAVAASEHPDLILLDMMMPAMDGFEVARLLKSDDALQAIPLIVVSSLDDVASRRRVMSAGADEVITKPIDRWQLLQHVARLLNQRAGNNG